MTFTDIILALRTAHTDIATAIEAQGVELSEGDGFADFAVAISQIKLNIPSNYGLVTFTAIIPTAANIMIS